MGFASINAKSIFIYLIQTATLRNSLIGAPW